MIIRSYLFSHQGGDLYEVLNHRRGNLLQDIAGIADLDRMNDHFLENLVKRSLVYPLIIDRDNITQVTRTEYFRGVEFPDRWMFMVRDAESYRKTVVRFSIPFTGDPALLRHCPSWRNYNPPEGEVNGNLIQFDFVFWGRSDDQKRLADHFNRNRDSIMLYTNSVNSDVAVFNQQLPDLITSAFNAKLDKLTEQHSFLDSLGVKKAPPARPQPSSSFSTAPGVKRETTRRGHIIQYIQHVYIQTIEQMNAQVVNQTNNNTGDVNNEIQSS